jgi:CheY-like chemotaxis protein
MSVPGDEQARAVLQAPRVILLVEDDALFATSLARLLRGACAVLCARTSTEAIGLVDRGGFDLLLCDYELGEDNALPILERAAARWPGVRRVVLTGQTAAHVQRALPDHAADVVLEKSVGVKQLGQALGLPLSGPRL